MLQTLKLRLNKLKRAIKMISPLTDDLIDFDEASLVDECLRNPILAKTINAAKLSIKNIYKVLLVGELGKKMVIGQRTITDGFIQRVKAIVETRAQLFNLADREDLKAIWDFAYKTEQAELLILCQTYKKFNFHGQVNQNILDAHTKRLFYHFYKTPNTFYGEDRLIAGALKAQGCILYGADDVTPTPDEIKQAYAHLAHTLEAITFIKKKVDFYA